MRTIKFRALRIQDNHWVYGNLIQISKDGKPNCTEFDPAIQVFEDGIFKGVHRINPESIGQFTGLRDMAGNDVYEGDLLSDTEPEPMILPVIYSDEYAMFCVDISYSQDGGAIEDIKTCYESGFLVIGNIHENPKQV